MKAFGGDDEAPASPPARAARPRVQPQAGRMKNDQESAFEGFTAPKTSAFAGHMQLICLKGFEGLVTLFLAFWDNVLGFIFKVLKTWYFSIPFLLLLLGAVNSHFNENGIMHHLEDRIDGEITPAAQAAAQERARLEGERDAANQRAAVAEARAVQLQQERDAALAQSNQLQGELRGVNATARSCQATLTTAREGYISVEQCRNDVTTYFNQHCAYAR